MATLSDDFTDVDGTALASHGSLGWTDVSSGITIQSNRAAGFGTQFGLIEPVQSGNLIVMHAKFWPPSDDGCDLLAFVALANLSAPGARGIITKFNNQMNLRVQTASGGVNNTVSLNTSWTDGDLLTLQINADGPAASLTHTPQDGVSAQTIVNYSGAIVTTGTYFGFALHSSSSVDDWSYDDSSIGGSGRAAPLLHSHSNRWPRNNTLLRM